MPLTFSSADLIGIIGAGAMGRGIAQTAAASGNSVIVVDSNKQALSAGEQAVAADLAGLVKRGKLAEDEAATIRSRILWSHDQSALAGARLVIEAIIEDLAIKSELFRGLEGIVGEQCILATNTSSLSVTALSRALSRPHRFAGLHFFNPATVMKLVEIVAGADTDPALLTALADLARRWKKAPVVVRDMPGFIVNRVARPYYGEGLRAWGEQIAAPEAIDHVMKICGGFRMGPLELADLIGHDVNYAVAQSVYGAYFGQTRFVPQLAQAELVAAGRLGRKSGRGIYDHKHPMPEPRFVTEAPAGAEDVHVQQSDGRSAARLAAELGKPVALFDWCRDPAADTLAVSVSDDSALAAALVHARGKKLILLADRPGMLALRTVCQLANGAADGLRDKLAGAEDIDQAMMFGANHPAGPFATAAQIGYGKVVAALDYIAEETGEAAFRPSEVLRRAAWSGRL